MEQPEEISQVVDLGYLTKSRSFLDLAPSSCVCSVEIFPNTIAEDCSVLLFRVFFVVFLHKRLHKQNKQNVKHTTILIVHLK